MNHRYSERKGLGKHDNACSIFCHLPDLKCYTVSQNMVAHFLFFLRADNQHFNLLDCCVPHAIHQMKSWLVGVGDPHHVISWLDEGKDVVYLVPPQINQDFLFNKLCLSHIIIFIHVSSITKNQILEVSFGDFNPLQHNNSRRKSSLGHRKKLHLGIVIEHDKPLKNGS